MIKESRRCYYAMFPFRHLPRMTVLQFMKILIFYVNAFVWNRIIYQIITPLTIVEGVVLAYNPHFRVIFGEHVQTLEGINKNMDTRTVNDFGLGPSVNLQGRLQCFSLVSGKVLNGLWKDVTMLKMPLNAIKRIDFMERSKHQLET